MSERKNCDEISPDAGKKGLCTNTSCQNSSVDTDNRGNISDTQTLATLDSTSEILKLATLDSISDSPTIVSLDNTCDTLELAKHDRESQGPWECEYSYGGEADLHRHYNKCDKNPGHKKFIPVDKFRMDDLPEDYRDEDVFDYIRAVSDLTVRVTVNYVSDKRPATVPGSSKPYPGYSDRGQRRVTVGTGCVNLVKECDDTATEYCKCIECRMSPRPETKFATMTILTASHVVFDELEAEHTTCHLFFDRGGTPDSCSGVVTLTGMSFVKGKVTEDVCYLNHYTHDLVLADRLKQTLKRMYAGLDKTNRCHKFKQRLDVLDRQPLLAIVSHPHGCSKQISLGRFTMVELIFTQIVSFLYNTATCPGSSGAKVRIFGYRKDSNIQFGNIVPNLVHCGVSDVQPKNNCSTYQRDIISEITSRLDEGLDLPDIFKDLSDLQDQSDEQDLQDQVDLSDQQDLPDQQNLSDQVNLPDQVDLLDHQDLPHQLDLLDQVDLQIMKDLYLKSISRLFERLDLMDSSTDIISDITSRFIERLDLSDSSTDFLSELTSRFIERLDLSDSSTDVLPFMLSLMSDQVDLPLVTGPLEDHGCFVEKGDESQHYAACMKNPGHKNFFPVEKFSLDNLPLVYRTDEVMEFIKCVSGLTVRLSVKYVSENTPESVPGTDIPYPWFSKRGSHLTRVGTGWVENAVVYEDEKCICEECKHSPNPKPFGMIQIKTAAYFIYDKLEAQHTTCDLFFDSGETPDACANVVTLADGRKSLNKTEINRGSISFLTHDLDLIHSLEEGICLYPYYLSKLRKYVKQLKKAEQEPPLHFVVSHPHGCAKQISIGCGGDQANADTEDSWCSHSSILCPGSCGAQVIELMSKLKYPVLE